MGKQGETKDVIVSPMDYRKLRIEKLLNDRNLGGDRRRKAINDVNFYAGTP